MRTQISISIIRILNKYQYDLWCTFVSSLDESLWKEKWKFSLAVILFESEYLHQFYTDINHSYDSCTRRTELSFTIKKSGEHCTEWSNSRFKFRYRKKKISSFSNQNPILLLRKWIPHWKIVSAIRTNLNP